MTPPHTYLYPPPLLSRYREEMKESTFCLAPLGHATWSIRMFESMMLGCIPVLVADDTDLPFQRWVDWSQVRQQ